MKRAILRGSTVIAVDIDNYKLDIAKKIGAHHSINSVSKDLHRSLETLTHGHGPSVVIEAAGNPITYQTAIEEVGFAGKVVCIGYVAQEVLFPTKLWVQKELMIMGSRNANPSDFEAVIHFLQSGRLDENMLISKILRPGEAEEAMSQWSKNAGNILKLMVDFNQP